jgi:hypothetical protein
MPTSRTECPLPYRYTAALCTLCWKPISLSVLSSLEFKGPQRLSQPVQGLARLAFLPEDDEAGGLPHVHLLLEVAVDESELDIHVMDAPPP